MQNKETQRPEVGKTEDKVPLISRRCLLVGTGGTLALAGLGCLKYAGATPVVRPPGGQDEERVLSACIRCERCFERCPRRVIRPSHIENGIVGMRTPVLSFDDNWCNWCADENDGVPLCVEACPTKALSLPEGAIPEKTILGIAVLNEDLCLAYRLIGCRFCYDACEYEAMELDKDGLPHVINDKCNGCGACESVCVSLKNGSIAHGATERAIVIRPLEEGM